MNKSKVKDLVSADYASVPTILPKFYASDVTGIKPGLSLSYRGPNITLPRKGQVKKKLPPLEPLPSMEMRSKAKDEFSFQSAREPKSQSILSKSTKVKLKPIEKSKKYEIMEGRSTHMDIVNYIEEVGDKEKDKFYYCIKGKNFYEYYVCYFEELDKDTADYITISTRGVTQFVNKEAEFFTLLDWKTEVESYEKVARIPFFKNYHIRKNFNLWDKLVKGTKMSERRSYLNKELFSVDSQLNKGIIGIRKILNGLVNGDLLQVVYTLNHLVA